MNTSRTTARSQERTPRGSCAGLGPLADRLLSAETADGLIAVVDELLHGLDATPAALYLHDGRHHAFYPVAGFAQETPSGDLPSHSVPPPGGIVLCSHGNPVGLLVVRPDAVGRVTELAMLLGPVLVQLHRRQIVVEELRETREIIAQLAVAGDLLRHLDLEILLTKVLEAGLQTVDAQVGAVLLPNEQGALAVRVAWGLEGAQIDGLRLRHDGRRVVDAVFADGTSIAIGSAEVAKLLDTQHMPGLVDGLLALPLMSRNCIHGVLLLANPTQGFGPAKRRLAETLCSLAGTAIDNALLVRATIEQERLKQEVALARTIQEKMFPPEGLAQGVFRIEGWSRPCSETGGDYYTYLLRPNGAVAMVGDVSGHGLGAALFTTMAHALVQQQLRAGASLTTAFQQINDGLYYMRAGRFMTAAAVEVDVRSGQCVYVSAGHCRTLWIHEGQVHWLDSTTMPLGIAPQLEFDAAPAIVLAPGDILLLYSDGIIEAMDPQGQTFGEERLADLAVSSWRQRLDPRAILAAIAAQLDVFTQGRAQSDDLTAVVLTRDA